MSAPALDIRQAWLSRQLDHDRQLYRAQFSPDGKIIAAGGQDRRVHLWQLDTGGADEEPSALDAHRSWVSALAFNPREPVLFTADYQGTIHAWDYQHPDRPPRWSIPGSDHDNVRALAVTPDGEFLISGGDDAVVNVWTAADGKPVTRLSAHAECLFSLAVAPDGQHLVSGDLLGSICHWSIGDGWKLTRKLDAARLHTRGEDFLADVGGVRSLAFSADGQQLAAGGMKEAESNAFCPGKPTAIVFDWGSGEARRELGLPADSKSDGPINALRFLADGTLVGHSERLHSESELVFWDTEQAIPSHWVKNHSSYDLSVHPDGRQLLTASYLSGGSSGNGARERLRENYQPNGTSLRIFSLFAKPPEPGK